MMELLVSRVVVMVVDNFRIRMQLNSGMNQLQMMRKGARRNIQKKRLVFCLLVLERIRLSLSDCMIVARIEWKIRREAQLVDGQSQLF